LAKLFNELNTVAHKRHKLKNYISEGFVFGVTTPSGPEPPHS